MAETLNFVQILWKDEQLPQLYPFATPYFNDTLSPFFENSIIAHLVPRTEADRIAVCSWNLRYKSKRFSVPPVSEITFEKLMSDYDVYAFTRNSSAHQMLAALKYHHNGLELFRSICAAIGLSCPSEVERPIYQNAFCARTEIYREYVHKALAPAMEVMEQDPKIREGCWADSKYYSLKDITPQNDFAQRVKRFLGVDYCPMHTFLLERLFSVFIHGKGLNIITV